MTQHLFKMIPESLIYLGLALNLSLIILHHILSLIFTKGTQIGDEVPIALNIMEFGEYCKTLNICEPLILFANFANGFNSQQYMGGKINICMYGKYFCCRTINKFPSINLRKLRSQIWQKLPISHCQMKNSSVKPSSCWQNGQ